MKVWPNIPTELGEWAQRQPIFFTGSAATHGQHVNVSPKGMSTTHFAVLSATRCAYIDRTGSGCETVAHAYENGRLCLMFLSFGPSPRILRLYCCARIVEVGDAGFVELVGRVAAQGGREVFEGVRAVVDCEVWKVTSSCGFAVPMVRRELYASGEVDDAPVVRAEGDDVVDNGADDEEDGNKDEANGHGHKGSTTAAADDRDSGTAADTNSTANGSSDAAADKHQQHHPAPPRDELSVFEHRPTLDRYAQRWVKRDAMLDYQMENNACSLDGLPGLVAARRRLGHWLWLDALKTRLRRLAAEKEAMAVGFVVALLLCWLLQLDALRDATSSTLLHLHLPAIVGPPLAR